MKKLLLISSLAAMLVSSCTKEELVLVNGIIQGYVMDYYKTEYISGAQIEYYLNGESVSITSDSSGFFSISGFPPGEHYLTISHAGYLSQRLYAWIEPIDVSTVKDGGKVDYIEQVDAELPELSASMRGTIKKEVGPNGVIRPAANMVISVRTDWSYYFPRIFSAVTNSNGEYFIDNLPATYVYLYMYPFGDEDNYYEYTYGSSFYLTPGAEAEYNEILGNQDMGIYLTSTNLEEGNGVYRRDFPVGENIVLTFNMDVSEDNTIDQGLIDLTGVVFDPAVDFTFSGNQVTINPPANLTDDTDYTLTFAIYSNIPGDYAQGVIVFHTAAP